MCGGSSSQPRRGPATGFIGETKEEEYVAVTSPPDYDISIVRYFALDLHKLFSKHSSTWFDVILVERKIECQI